MSSPDVVENVVLARNLRQVADTHVVERYKEILEAEHGALEREPPKQLQR